MATPPVSLNWLKGAKCAWSSCARAWAIFAARLGDVGVVLLAQLEDLRERAGPVRAGLRLGERERDRAGLLGAQRAEQRRSERERGVATMRRGEPRFIGATLA
jgi:hypothetical protein